MSVKRILTEKKLEFNIEGKQLEEFFKKKLEISEIKSVRVINVYDIEGDIDQKDYDMASKTIFSEPPVDKVSEELILSEGETAFRVEPLPGQYDQRSDSAIQCEEIVSLKTPPLIRSSKIFVIKGNITEEDLAKIKKHLINPVESREVGLSVPQTISINYEEPQDIKTFNDFITYSETELISFRQKMGLAMTIEDLKTIQSYFKKEGRNPTETEIKVIDTYWSDHCRHTTFQTIIDSIEVENGKFTEPIKEALSMYLSDKRNINSKPITLMDMATLAMKKASSEGKLDNLDKSDEINACSINVMVNIDGKEVPYLIQFKNETHNHPTEIEPFGGASTCLGGAIRDPLSGRAYVYQAMRITGSGDPRTPIDQTIAGKLPTCDITQKAANGYSSYGNQIGLATGHVVEVYDHGFVAKRMELGAVVGAVPKENVVRETPATGDLVLLIGGRTGRDGIGGATGSSKAHSINSLEKCGAEVQKGNPPEERKLQNLFRIPEVSKMIKRCNDFGAGGVAVAIGELAPSLEIDLDAVPKKYAGLDGTEIAISESQERMAVVIDYKDLETFKKYCHEQNVECTQVAKITNTGCLEMKWRGKTILNIERFFLDTNGAPQRTNVKIKSPLNPNRQTVVGEFDDLLLKSLSDINVCSQQGLVERFDSTIGGNTILMPYGGKYYKAPTQVMAAKIPILKGECKTATIMSHGYDPEGAIWSPFHGAMNAIVDSVTKIILAGGNLQDIRLSLQEYFEKLGDDPEKWGKPSAALLGAYYAQQKLGVAAIGGKDSMSGTFEDITVPPTLVSFALAPAGVDSVKSPEMKSRQSNLYYFDNVVDENGMPNFEKLKEIYDEIQCLNKKNAILSSYAVERGGLLPSLCKMAFGNKIGFEVNKEMGLNDLFKFDNGSIIIEATLKPDQLSSNFKLIGKTNDSKNIKWGDKAVDIDKAINSWESTLEPIFPKSYDKKLIPSGTPINKDYDHRSIHICSETKGMPNVFIPVFPGTNCETDTRRAFEKAGANVETLIFKNLTPNDIAESIAEMAKLITKSQIICLSGGFSAGDEPDGSAKFITSVLRNPKVAEKVMELLNRDGLMLGICNGFQALLKSGLLPDGAIRDLSSDSPTLVRNLSGNHISAMVNTRVASVNSPWMYSSNVGDTYITPISHGEGRFYADYETRKKLFANGQVATQYVDLNNTPTYDSEYNMNGSCDAIEGVFSPDGRIYGKMGHIERGVGNSTNYINIPGMKEPPFIQDGVNYYIGRDRSKVLTRGRR